jgi:MFS family permease
MKENFQFLRRPEILILGFSSIVSGIGNWITMMAILSLVIFQGDGGVAESSGIFMAGLLPIMLASPLAGKLADRFDRKRLMMISEFGAGATIGIIIFTEKLWLIYLAMALQGLFVALMNPARQSALPQLVRDAGELERVNAFFQQLNSMLKIIAPMVAGFLLTIMGAHQAIIVDIISFGISVVILSRLPRLLPSPVGATLAVAQAPIPENNFADKEPFMTDAIGAGASPAYESFSKETLNDNKPFMTNAVGAGASPAYESFSKETLNDKKAFMTDAIGAGASPAPTGTVVKNNEALTYLKQSRALRLLFVSSFLCILIIVGFDILGSVYIRDVLGGDESFLGLMISLIGIGSFITTLLVVLRKSGERNWPDLALGVFLLAVLPLGMALGYIITDPGAVKVLVIVCCFVGGLGNGFLMIQVTTILQITSPQQILGRLSGYLETSIIGGQLFSVVMLPIFVPNVIDPMVYFLAATVALLVVSLLIVFQSRSILRGSSIDGGELKSTGGVM